jgi:hypothetical protein
MSDRQSRTRSTQVEHRAVDTAGVSSELQETILARAAQQGIPQRIIDLPSLFVPEYDDGKVYVSDLNNVIRFYFEGPQQDGTVVPTEDFVENAQVVEGDERTVNIDRIYDEA